MSFLFTSSRQEALQEEEDAMLCWHVPHTDDLWLNPQPPHALRCAVKPEIIKLMPYHNMQMTTGSIPVSGSQ